MTKAEKKRWLKDAMRVVLDGLVSQVEKMPRKWNELELRALLADVFGYEQDANGEQLRLRGSRKTAYERAKARINY